MSADNKSFKVDFKINKENPKTDEFQRPESASAPKKVEIGLHKYSEISPAYALCKTCNKPETDANHIKQDYEMTTVTPQSQELERATRPSAEIVDLGYSSGADDKEEEIPQTQVDPSTYSKTMVPMEGSKDIKTLVDVLTKLEDMMGSEVFTPRDLQIAEGLLNNASSLLEELRNN